LDNNMPHNVELLSFTPTEDGGRLYERDMRILTDTAGTPYPDPAGNIVRLVGVTGDGAVVMWNLAVVSQKGSFYLTTQEMFAAQAYRDGDKVVIPGIDAQKWQLLRKYLEDMLSETETLSKLALPALLPMGSNGKHELEDGEVEWYSQHMQTGCIQTRRGKASVHWTSIKTQRPDGLLYLLPGEKVSYDLIPRPPKPSNRRQSSFEWEAKNVTVRE
jgi:cold shock CspA family protein